MRDASLRSLRFPEQPESARAELGDTDQERAYYRLSRRIYSVFAYPYDAVTFPFRGLRREVVDAARLRPGASVLDVATGTGAQALAFADVAGTVVGVDLSEAMLRMARRKHSPRHVTFQRADAAALPFANETFDAACVSFALHEMPSSVRDRVLREMARVTRPGGTIVVVDYGLPQQRLARSLVFRAVKLYEGELYADFMRSDLDALLRAAGIEPRGHRSALRGLARITLGRRSERNPG